MYRVSVKRSEGSAELGISGDYLLSICEKGLYLKTTNDFEVQIWEYDSIASVVESSESAKLLNVEIKKSVSMLYIANVHLVILVVELPTV